MGPTAVVLLTSAALCLATWTASLVTHEHSWVDRIWSVAPVIYVGSYAAATGFSDPRLTLMTALVAAWGARLTFNFARKGGYSGQEDYRWAVLRARMSRWQFEVFNVAFIVLYQNAILVLISLPALTAWQHRATPFGTADVVLGLLFAGLLVGETVADQQQWDFQQAKKAALASGRSPVANFVRTGLWRYSRHPNFFCEQAQWWVLFGFGAVAARSPLVWTGFGAVLLTLLFLGSTRFTESLSLAKYPEYAQYRRATSAVVPWFARAREASAPR